MRREIPEVIRVVSDPNYLGGLYRIEGTRINVTLILACLRDGITIKEICEDFELTVEMIEVVIDFSIQFVGDKIKKTSRIREILHDFRNGMNLQAVCRKHQLVVTDIYDEMNFAIDMINEGKY